VNNIQKFTVIIPAFNAEATVAETIQSVLNQHYSVDQIIVIDDGSTDKTAEIVKKLQPLSPALEYVYQENSGVSSARNKGINLAKHENIFFLDSDDVWLPSKVRLHIEHLESHADCVGSFTNYILFNEPRGCLAEANKFLNQLPINSTNISLNLSRVNGSCSSFLGNKYLLISSGGFDESLSFGEDLDLWVRYTKVNEICELIDVAVAIRTTTDTKTKNKRNEMWAISKLYFCIWEKNDTKFQSKLGRRQARLILRVDIRRNLVNIWNPLVNYPRHFSKMNSTIFKDLFRGFPGFYLYFISDTLFEICTLLKRIRN